MGAAARANGGAFETPTAASGGTGVAVRVSQELLHKGEGRAHGTFQWSQVVWVKEGAVQLRPLPRNASFSTPTDSANDFAVPLVTAQRFASEERRTLARAKVACAREDRAAAAKEGTPAKRKRDQELTDKARMTGVMLQKPSS